MRRHVVLLLAAALVVTSPGASRSPSAAAGRTQGAAARVGLATEFAGRPGMQEALTSGLVRARSMAAADFDEDGVADLVTGYDDRGRGLVALQRGDRDAFYPQEPGASARRRLDGLDPAAVPPFHAAAAAFELPEPATFLGTGDFDADGHLDVLAAAAGGHAVYLLPGDGHGGFGPPRRRPLDGAVDALVAGEMDRPDGLADFAVAVESDDGSASLRVFESPRGAWTATAERFALASPATDLALGDLDGDLTPELVAAAGSQLVVVHPRDRKLSLGVEARATARSARVERLPLGFAPGAVAVARVPGAATPWLVALSGDGSVRVAPGTSPGSFEDLATAIPGGGLRPAGRSARGLPALWSAAGEGKAVAALPLRLGGDAVDGLVVLREGTATPLSLQPESTLAVFTVTSTTDGGAGSLRDAIANANATPGTDQISFNIPGPGPYVISPLSPLPDVTDPVLIDGTSQPGYAGSPIIELDGAASGVGTDGLLISSGGTTVRGLVVRGFDGSGIRLRSNGGNIIEHDYIGTDLTGTTSVPNHHDGVRIEDSSVNTIGGTVPDARNVISGNGASGVDIDAGASLSINYPSTDVPKAISDFTTTMSMLMVPGAGAVTDVNVTLSIRHTYDADLQIVLIGPDGTPVNLSLNNGGSGDDYTGTVFDDSGTVPITAGTPPFASPPSYIPQSPLSALVGAPAGGVWMLQVTDTAAGDTGALTAWSIQLTTAPTFGNQIVGNYIGTDASGTAALGNAVDGVRISNSPMNKIGGPSVGERNVISGNPNAGVETVMAGAAKTTIQGNYIGTDLTGSSALAETNGIYLASGLNLVGGTAPGAGNLVSGNGSAVVDVGVHVAASDNLVQGNLIGTDASGTASVPNGYAGVEVEGFNSTVGGAVAGAGNVISGNATLGIFLGPGGGTNWVQGNLIGTQVGGVAPLGNGTGGIDVVSSTNNIIGGSTPPERNVISANGSGGVFLGSTGGGGGYGGNRVQGNFIGTDATGAVAMGNGYNGVEIATHSNVIGGPMGGGWTNVISGNGGAGIAFDSTGYMNQVEGNIIGLDVSAVIPLPNAGDGMSIGGGGNAIGGVIAGWGNVISANGGAGIQAVGGPGTTMVTYSSTDVPKAIPDLSTVSSTLNLTDGSTVLDVNVTVDITHTYDADLVIRLVGPGGYQTVLSNRRGGSGDNFTGTVFDDEAASPIASGVPPFAGSFVPDQPLAAQDGTSAAGTWTLSVDDKAAGDVGTLNSWSITLTVPVSASGAGNEIYGNLIGTDGTGTLPRGNTGPGVLLNNAAGNRVGDSAAGTGNLISDNAQGVVMEGPTAAGNLVQQDHIGTQIDGMTPLGNHGDGVLFTGGATANHVTGSTIAFNGAAGVHVESGRSDWINWNSIYSNAGLGIDLEPLGVNPNDPGDTDLGPNDLENYPEVTAVPSGGITTMSVTFNGHPNSLYDFDLFSSTSPDPSGFGEGQTLVALGTAVLTDAAGNVSFSIGVPGTLPYVTATATDQAHNTSEFSGVSRSVLEASPAKDMTVLPAGGTALQVNYTPACGATDHVIYWGREGPATIGPGGLSWFQGACGLGVTGTAFFDPGPLEPGQAIYFIIAGQNGSVEGSYGQDSLGVEEPEATLPIVCDLPQYLYGVCY